MKFVYFNVLAVVFFLVGVMFSSCYIPPATIQSSSTSTTETETNNNNNNNDDDENEGSRRSTVRLCGDRDSCQDSCDDIFGSSSARSECYDLEYRDINIITEVADNLEVETDVDSREMGCPSSVDLDDLEDISADDLDVYLSIGIDDFVDAIEDCDSGDADVKKLLEWISEEEDIAEVILNNDDRLELGRIIFEKAPAGSRPLSASGCSKTSSGDFKKGSVCWKTKGDPTEIKVDTYDETSDEYNFLQSFLSKDLVDGESFLSASDRNEAAFSWGHNTLVNFCEDITDENKDDVEVKQCLQAVYCTFEDREEIFKDLDKFESVVGETDEQNCKSARFEDEDRIEDQFE